MKKRKISNIIKHQVRKLKYLDKTQARYFIVTGFLLSFCLFTGGTYSYFAFTEHLHATTITIGNLTYELSSNNTAGSINGNRYVMNVKAGSRISLNLDLESLNSTDTKYALNYDTSSPDSDVKVYYSESYANNMSGIIGPTGSKISMRVIIENNSTVDTSVYFIISGGYLQNTLDSNITEGYYEEDIQVRAVLIENDLNKGIINENFPTKGSGYLYFRTECSEEVDDVWDNANWKLNLNNIPGRVSCDVYFKKMTNDVELYYALKKKDGTVTYVTSVPNDGTYTFKNAKCNTDATASWDTSTWSMNVSGIKEKTICIGTFEEN